MFTAVGLWNRRVALQWLIRSGPADTSSCDRLVLRLCNDEKHVIPFIWTCCRGTNNACYYAYQMWVFVWGMFRNCERLSHEERHKFWSLPDILLQRTNQGGWEGTGHVVRVEEVRNACRLLTRNLEVNIQILRDLSTKYRMYASHNKQWLVHNTSFMVCLWNGDTVFGEVWARFPNNNLDTVCASKVKVDLMISLRMESKDM